MGPRLVLVTALLFSPEPALADRLQEIPGPRLGLHVGVEHFGWEEKDPAQRDRELVAEEGPLTSAAVTLDSFERPAEGPIYGLEGRLYQGTVDYDGETQAGVPARTDVDYLGGLGEARLGYRFMEDWSAYGFDVMGGLGTEYWSRDIQDGYDANGNRVVGYEEEYAVIYARAGAGIVTFAYGEWFSRLEVGVRYPLTVDERVDELNASLSPGPRPSPYATYEVSKRIPWGYQVGVTLYYDSYRFAESPLAPSSIGLVRQPESELDVIGLRFGVFL